MRGYQALPANWHRMLVAIAFFIAPTAFAGPPFVTDDPVPPDYRTWEVNYAATGTLGDGVKTAALPGIDINYGGAPGVQLHLQVQMAYFRDQNSVAYGFGDTEAGVKVRLTQATGESADWAIGIYPILHLPTGSARRQLGSGASSLYLPLWVQTTRGRWTTFGGGGYSVNDGADRRNNWSAGWAALYEVRAGLQLGGEMFLKTSDTAGGETSSGFNLGGILALPKGYSLLFSAGRSLQTHPAENRFSSYLGIRAQY